MRMSRSTMYARLLASDSSCNGRFFAGVTTTGIYCLPGCKARKPRPENVRFFPTSEAARAAGLRPCRKCHPDDFARGADFVLETIETLVAAIRAEPASFPDVRAVVQRSGFGSTRLFELLRLHYHATPASVLLHARIDAARDQLLSSGRPLAEIALGAGFESLSAFHERFKQLNGLTPSEFRDLPGATAFRLHLPEGYPVPYLHRALGRDSQSASERREGDGYALAVRIGGRAGIIRLEVGPSSVAVTTGPGTAVEAHRIATGLLGLDQDAAAFARLARSLGLARLVAGRPGLRILQTASVFDGLLWAIIGQQINFTFACTLKRRLFELCGEPAGDGLVAPPAPGAVAGLTRGALQRLQFSRQKADYLLNASRLVAAGELDLEALRQASATRAARTLLAVRGLGPWSVNYLMMRSLGFADCLPLGDTGVTGGLKSLFALDERPDADGTRRLMGMFSPHQSLATAHLWQFNQPAP